MIVHDFLVLQQVMEEWREITGQQLLERYGKTELGMVLSDPIEVDARKSGFVGNPMPGVQVRVVKPGSAGEPGNILLMGDNDGTTILQVGVMLHRNLNWYFLPKSKHCFHKIMTLIGQTLKQKIEKIFPSMRKRRDVKSLVVCPSV